MVKKNDKKAGDEATGTAVVEQAAQLPSTKVGFGGYTPAAKELDQEQTMPVLQLLQSNSKAAMKQHDLYVEGAEAGMLLCRASESLYAAAEGDGTVFVPCARQRAFVAWVPRDDEVMPEGITRAEGSGRRGTYQPEDPIVQEAIAAATDFGRYYTPDGLRLVETFYVFGYILPDADSREPGEHVILAVTSKKIKPYKTFFSRIRSCLVPVGSDGYVLRDADGAVDRESQPAGKLNPPMFAHRVRLKAVMDRQGSNDFFNLAFEFAVGDDRDASLFHDRDDVAMLKHGAEIERMVEGGEVKVGEEEPEEAGADKTEAF